MNEAEWRSCNDPARILEFMCDKASLRKHRLLPLAVCRLLDRGPKNDRLLRFLDGLEDAVDGSMRSFPIPRSFPLFGVEVVDKLGTPASWIVNLLFEEDSSNRIVSILTESWCQSDEASKAILSNLAREVYGDPFNPVIIEPAWLTPDVVSKAQSMYDERNFDRMPTLGIALERAGCEDADIISHCRPSTGHARGCWVVDAILGKS